MHCCSPYRRSHGTCFIDSGTCGPALRSVRLSADVSTLTRSSCSLTRSVARWLLDGNLRSQPKRETNGPGVREVFRGFAPSAVIGQPQGVWTLCKVRRAAVSDLETRANEGHEISQPADDSVLLLVEEWQTQQTTVQDHAGGEGRQMGSWELGMSTRRSYISITLLRSACRAALPFGFSLSVTPALPSPALPSVLGTTLPLARHRLSNSP